MTERRSLEESATALYGKKKGRSKEGSKSSMWVPDQHALVAGGADITFFKTGWEDSDLSNHTLPRRYINRSSFTGVNFTNTDFNQSFMCWNDFTGCDFTDADLTCCDMRASVFEDCTFVRCKLMGADLRRSSFEGCDFTDADLTGAKLDSDVDIEVSDEQFDQMDWQDEGPEPPGG